MARIFSALAVIAIVLLATNFAIGLSIGDFASAVQHKHAAYERYAAVKRSLKRNESSPELEEATHVQAKADAALATPAFRKNLHMLLGVAAALVTVLVNSITVTYFIGTTRWCQEVCDTYNLSPDLVERSTRLKRSTFPWALAGILSVIVLVGLGAAADPVGANMARSTTFVTPHYAAAIIGIVIVIAAFWVQINRIAENYAVIELIVAEVQRVRAERQLPVEESAAP